MVNEVEAEQEVVVEKTSKLRKVRNVAGAAAFYGIATAATVIPTYYSWKIIKMNYETAALNLEAARNAAEQIANQ